MVATLPLISTLAVIGQCMNFLALRSRCDIANMRFNSAQCPA